MDKTRSILIVDDDPLIRHLLAEGLRMEGFVIYEATDGKDALHVLKQIPIPNLILTDFNMPNLNGADFVGRKNLNSKIRHIPVIVISSDANAQSLLSSVQAVIPKPFDFDDLIWKVKTLIEAQNG